MKAIFDRIQIKQNYIQSKSQNLRFKKYLYFANKKQRMQHINSYLQYCSIVGDNGGIMMSQKQFDEYKKKHQALSENRLHTTWVNKNGEECKNIALTSKCFCDHLYKNHDYLGETSSTKVKCKAAGCKCSDYVYLPIYGSQDFKCSCKHSYQNHDIAKKNCKSCVCKEFVSNWACSCGQKYSQHKTVSAKSGGGKTQSVHPTQGKVTSYSSMLDRVDRHEENIKQEVKKQGLKVTIEEFVISKPVLREEKSAWDLYNTPIAWIK